MPIRISAPRVPASVSVSTGTTASDFISTIASEVSLAGVDPASSPSIARYLDTSGNVPEVRCYKQYTVTNESNVSEEQIISTVDNTVIWKRIYQA